MVWLWGWHVFDEILKNKSRKIKKIQILEKFLYKIQNKVEKHLIEVVNSQYMDNHFGKNHQGIAIFAEQIKFWNLKDWLNIQKENSCLIASDLIEDCQNLGAIIRTARAFGASGLLFVNKKSAPFNGNLAKASAGALESLPIVQVANLSTALNFLKNHDFKIFGLEQGGTLNWKKSKRNVIVLGQEGNGLRQLTKKTCDITIAINTQPDFGVLNVSAAAGIIISKFLE